MVCPFCLTAGTKVYNSRQTKKVNETWRRRHCPKCKRDFTTREHTDPQSVIKVAVGTKKLPFSYGKFLLSILRACDHRPDDDASLYLAESILQNLYNAAASNNQLVTPKLIADSTAGVLKNYDQVAWIKYTAIHK